MKEYILNLQKQNNDLETEQSKDSALMKFKHKLANDKGQSICVASPWNIKVGQHSTKHNIDFNNKHTDKISQKGTEFEKYSMKAFNVIEKNALWDSFYLFVVIISQHKKFFDFGSVVESPRVSLIFNIYA